MDWFDLLAVQGTLKSLQHHSPKAAILLHLAFFIVQLSHPYMTTGKTIYLTRWTIVGKVMFLLFNMLSRLVTAILPRSKRLLISWLQSHHLQWFWSPKYMQSTSWEMLDWRKNKLESRLPGEISITSDMQMTPPYGRKWRGTKEPLDESERGEWKSWLKPQHSENEDHGIWSHHFMTNRWGNSENSERLYFLELQNHCGRWLQMWKRHLLIGRKAVTNLDSILKSRDITLLTKVCIVKAMVFPIVMYRCESWTIKKVEHWRIYAFELWCWRRLFFFF